MFCLCVDTELRFCRIIRHFSLLFKSFINPRNVTPSVSSVLSAKAIISTFITGAFSLSVLICSTGRASVLLLCPIRSLRSFQRHMASRRDPNTLIAAKCYFSCLLLFSVKPKTCVQAVVEFKENKPPKRECCLASELGTSSFKRNHRLRHAEEMWSLFPHNQRKQL